MTQTLINLTRIYKKAVMIGFDAIAVICIIFISFWIRLGYFYYPTGNHELLLAIYTSPIIAIPIFNSFGLYREVTRYISSSTLWIIIKAATIYAALWGLMVFMLRPELLPRSAIIINWTLVILIISSSRFIVRWLLQENLKSINVVIYGAGSAGRQLYNALKQSGNYNPIAFIDDSKELNGQSIHGAKVFLPGDLNFLIDIRGTKEVLLAIPSLSRNRRREIINFLGSFQVAVRSLPGVLELAQGKVKVNDLLEIDLRDLLGRYTVEPKKELFERNIFNKVVMVSGAGGSIGSELSRQIILHQPKKILLYELSESSLYHIDQELRKLKLSNTEVYSILGSVCDEARVRMVCQDYGVQTIYHAAAYKHVPLVENNKSQGVYNNSIGTLILAEAAIASNVETFVLISTDKAVRPSNFMGASKRVAEIILQALSKLSHNTNFTMVRFGNVLDSSGSVIPLFKKQISEGGPLTVTHPEIVRYFMMIPEAVELVIQAGAMAKGGEVFVLNMGQPVRIYDLAVKMIELSGLQVRDDGNPEGDIEILYTGLRPGEKLFEELLIEGEFSSTENDLIMRAKEKSMSWDDLKPILTQIKQEGSNLSNDEVFEFIIKIVPEFKTKSS